MRGLLLLCAAICHCRALAAWVYGAPDRVVPAPLRIGAILRTDETQQMINSWLLFVSTVNAHGGLRLQSEQTLLQLVIIEADAVDAAGNVSFWVTVGEVQTESPEGLIVTTGSTGGLTNAFSLFDDETEILNMLIRTVHQKVSMLTVLVESGYQGCDNVRTIAAQWKLLVVVQALEDPLESLVVDTALLLCASATASQRFVRSAKLADYMPQAILVTCPVLELQSTLGEDADFLIAFQRELPAADVDALGAAARSHSQFVEDYKRCFLQLPSDAAVLAYSSAQHLAQAIAAADSEPDAVAALLRQRGQAVTGQVVQLQAGAATQVSFEVDLRFPAASWAERPCWHQGLEGFGFRDGHCSRCNSTEEVRVNWTSGRRECVPCPGASGSGETTCRCEACGSTSCAPGRSNESGSCVPCAPGRFAFGAATSSCTLCPPGFISKDGASSCEACGLGYYAPEGGLSECLPCQLGHAANTTGRSACSSCPAGTFGFMGLCQECPVGSFQAVPGQSACREDGLGQRSSSTASVSPGNVPGFYAIWAASDEAFRRARFEMEPCVKEEACGSMRCGHGSTGRQCFGVLGGFSAGASARYKCVSWQLYMAIGIGMAVFYLAAYTRFATVLATSEVASHQLYLMMLKMLVNHCASMSVLLSCFLRATTHSPLLESFLSLLMITDGVPPCGDEVFSLHCLLQPWRTQEVQQAFDALASASQVDYSSPALADARATLATFHRNTELRSLIFWASLPLVAALLPCLLLLMWLRIYMARHAQHWLKAAEFSSKVHLQGFEVTCSAYAPEAVQQIMAISSRRLWGLSWPLMHCNAWVHSSPPIRSIFGSFCCCLLSPILFIPRLFSKLDLLRFWTETVPLRTCLLYFFWFPAARRCFSTLHCQRLGAAVGPMPGRVMYSNGVLECDLSQPLLLVSLFAGSLWTMWPFFCWFQLYQQRSMDANFRRHYGIMLLGYNTSCWCWEVVVCLQKFLFIVIEAVPFSAVQECFLIVCVSLVAMLCHVTWRPFDHRWFDLLIRLEIKHLLVLLCSAFLCMISLQNWLLPETTVILMAGLQVIYVLTLLLSFGHLKLLGTDTSTLKHWEKGCLKRFLKFLLAYKRWYNDSEPYIAYDNVHRYVSVLANVGGQCTLPHLPIGRQLEAAGQKSHAQVRCKLSDVPRHLKSCSFVSSVQQRDVSRELLFTVAALAKDSETMSSFLLDFVVRAAFLLAADLRERHSEADELPQEVDKHAWQEANRKRDLLVIASMAEEQRQRDLLYGKATRGGPSIQKDLELEEEAIFGWGLLQDAVAETDQQAMTDAGLAHGRQLSEIGEAEALVQQKVYRMFSPTISRRGCTLQELKASMLLLRNTPREELQQWLDFFEKVWFLEFLDSDKEIHLMSGTRLEQGVHADAMEILKASRRPRRVTQNALGALGEPVQDGMEENNIKVYLKWVRFVLYHYCGGIQAVDLGDIMRTRLSRPSRFVIQSQMEKVDEEEAENQAKPEVVSVDEDALQRVEKGLEAALAAGLSLEPAQRALERLERGVDWALSLDESADEISLQIHVDTMYP